MPGACGTCGGEEKRREGFVGKPEPLGRHKHR